MPVFQHSELPIHTVPRIKTRVLVDAASGAQSTAVWEQWIQPGGYIPEHYHDVEEVLVILSGYVELQLDGNRHTLIAPATVLIPPGQLHQLQVAGSSEVHLLAMFPVARPIIYAPDGNRRPLPWDDYEG